MYPKSWTSEHSHYFESYFTHVLLKDLMQALLLSDEPRRMTVLHAEVDSEGYDLVLACGPTLRYVQFKARGGSITAFKYSIKASMTQLPGACVLWLLYDPGSLERTCYYLLAGEPGEILGDLLPTSVAHRNKGGQKVDRSGYVNAQMRDANHVRLSPSALAEALFGSHQKGQ
jgi:hypothetical protein